MSNEDSAPTTLLEAVRYFADEDVALAFIANLRWPDGKQVCPHCGSVAAHYFLKARRVWKCREKECRKQFSIKVGTVFEDSPIPLAKWLPALWMLANCKNGISSYELARALGVTQKTGWFMLHRIRLAMQTKTFEKLSGTIEADETFIGGKVRFMHANKRRRVMAHEDEGKTIVMGLLERHTEKPSQVRAAVVLSRRKPPLKHQIVKHVEPGSTLMTDALASYSELKDYRREFVNHAEEYVRGNVHTNGIENFWSLLKRAIKGTYVSVEPFHLFRYLDEQAFRFNMRKDTDLGRFVRTLADVVSKRLTCAELTGATMSRLQA